MLPNSIVCRLHKRNKCSLLLSSVFLLFLFFPLYFRMYAPNVLRWCSLRAREFFFYSFAFQLFKIHENSENCDKVAILLFIAFHSVVLWACLTTSIPNPNHIHVKAFKKFVFRKSKCYFCGIVQILDNRLAKYG